MPLPTHVLPSLIIHVPYIKAEPNEEAVGFTVTYICRLVQCLVLRRPLMLL